MLSQRFSLRLAQQAASRARPAMTKRFQSTNVKPGELPDNKFNRERAAVKAHAAATSG